MKVREMQVKSGGYLFQAPVAPPQSSCAGPLPAGGLPGPGGTSQAGWHLRAQSWCAKGWVLLQLKSTQRWSVNTSVQLPGVNSQRRVVWLMFAS